VFVRPPVRILATRNYSKALNNRDDFIKKKAILISLAKIGLSIQHLMWSALCLVCVELEVGPVVTKLPTLHQVR
jgi:hypothetical protein